MNKYEARVTQITLVPEGEQIFSEQATTIEIADEAAGEYVVVKQNGGNGDASVLIDKEEWPALRDAIEKMIANCK